MTGTGPTAKEPAATPVAAPGPVFPEVLLAFSAATAACALLYASRTLHPLLLSYLQVAIAAIFWFWPKWLLERSGRELSCYGLRLRPFSRHLLWAAGAVLVVFPPFAVGFWLYHRTLCGAVHPLSCVRFLPPHPFGAGSWHVRPNLAAEAVAQLFVVALPEEFFFRGYLQGRLREVLSPAKAILASALLFGLGHFLVDFDPGRLAVLFPGLVFGLLRERTGSILPSAVFHAACNLYSLDVLGPSFFP